MIDREEIWSLPYANDMVFAKNADNEIREMLSSFVRFLEKRDFKCRKIKWLLERKKEREKGAIFLERCGDRSRLF